MSEIVYAYKFPGDFRPWVTPKFVEIGSPTKFFATFGLYDVLVYILAIAQTSFFPIPFRSRSVIPKKTPITFDILTAEILR